MNRLSPSYLFASLPLPLPSPNSGRIVNNTTTTSCLLLRQHHEHRCLLSFARRPSAFSSDSSGGVGHQSHKESGAAQAAAAAAANNVPNTTKPAVALLSSIQQRRREEAAAMVVAAEEAKARGIRCRAAAIGLPAVLTQQHFNNMQQLRNISHTTATHTDNNNIKSPSAMSNGTCNGGTGSAANVMENGTTNTDQNNHQQRRVLTMNTINPNVITMEYAVRGPIVNRAVELERLLAQAKEKEFPFSNVIKANIGDAHAMGQNPITFIRQVVACVADPTLITSPDQNYPDDVREKALELLRSCGGGSAGSYSQSTGIETIRQHVAQFIAERDGFPCDSDSVCLSGGASESIRNVLKLFVHWHHPDEKKKSGIMIPIPQYPLYSASIEEFNLGQVGYYLNEQKNWALDTEELERSLAEHQQRYDVLAIVVINPGNPTGQVLTRSNIEDIIRFAHRHHLFIFADEVYQENVYADGAKFHSFRKIMKEMGPPFNTLELASFYSCSKGYMGECGLRGGYVQFENIDPEVYAHYKKMISAKLCSTILGQIAIDCVVDHPKPGAPSFDLWLREKTHVLTSLKERAKMVTDAYNAIEGVHCQNVQGAMYAFPRILLPDKAIVEAKSIGVQPDFFYCSQLLEATGICVVPGSGFGQYPGTWHFRTTILPPTTTFQDMLGRFKGFHEAFMAKYK